VRIRSSRSTLKWFSSYQRVESLCTRLELVTWHESTPKKFVVHTEKTDFVLNHAPLVVMKSCRVYTLRLWRWCTTSCIILQVTHTLVFGNGYLLLALPFVWCLYSQTRKIRMLRQRRRRRVHVRVKRVTQKCSSPRLRLIIWMPSNATAFMALVPKCINVSANAIFAQFLLSTGYSSGRPKALWPSCRKCSNAMESP